MASQPPVTQNMPHSPDSSPVGQVARLGRALDQMNPVTLLFLAVFAILSVPFGMGVLVWVGDKQRHEATLIRLDLYKHQYDAVIGLLKEQCGPAAIVPRTQAIIRANPNLPATPP